MGLPSGPSIETCFLFVISILLCFPFSDSSVKWLFKCSRIDLLDPVLKSQSVTEQINIPSDDLAGVTTQIWSFSAVDISVKESNPDGVVGGIFGNGEDKTEDCKFASRIRRSSHTVLPLIIYQFIQARDTKLTEQCWEIRIFHSSDEWVGLNLRSLGKNRKDPQLMYYHYLQLFRFTFLSNATVSP